MPPQVAQFKGFCILWHIYNLSDQDTDVSIVVGSEEADDRIADARQKINHLGTLPSELVMRIPTRVINGVECGSLRLITGTCRGVIDYFREAPRVPRFEDDPSRDCPICLESLPRPDHIKLLSPLDADCVVATMLCGHLFHYVCLQETFGLGTHSVCPLCKTPADRFFIFPYDKTTGQIKFCRRMGCLMKNPTSRWNQRQWAEFRFKYHCAARPEGEINYRLDELRIFHVIPGIYGPGTVIEWL